MIEESKEDPNENKRFILQITLFFGSFSCFLILAIYNMQPICNFKLLNNIKILIPNENFIPREFSNGERLWRPVKKDHPEIPFDFDEHYDDRILRQRKWIKDMTYSPIFKDLKPKRILVSDTFPEFYGDGKLHCADNADEWESKCSLELEKDTAEAINYPANINKFDAVMEFRFWYPQLGRKLPNGSSVIQILQTYECPYATPKEDLSLNNALLATYWRGSDIPLPYATWIPFKKYANRQPKSTVNYAEGKNKFAAIVVSNCKPRNKCMEYVKELQRYIPVDIYGKCGTQNCTEPCYKNLGKDYKFYLAFENTNCRDYITEKFFVNALSNNMVPVVLGAHKKDYLSAAPPNSFIHVEDFESPNKLAEFLKEIDENDNMYNEYFKWKIMGQFIDTRSDFFCRACALLHIADYIQRPVWPPNSTWESVNVCLQRGRWYWDRPNIDDTHDFNSTPFPSEPYNN